MRVTVEEIPPEVISSPALLYLYHRIEQILGIKAPGDGLIKLNAYLERNSGASFIQDSAAYERVLGLPETIFTISHLLTINETYFFREGPQISLLLHFFLPQLLRLNRPVRICSAAGSIGCEAYSLAMLLDYYAKENGRQFTYEIDAFDINAEAIKTAKSGRYTVNTLRSDGAEWKYILDSYLAPDGNEYVVSHNIRNKIRFFTHNVMDGFDRQYDIIFFRNALIYFSPESRWAIMDDIAEALFNDGVLFLGTTETSSVSHPLLLNRYMSGVFYFQKIPAVRLSEVSRPLPDGPLPDAKPPNSPLPPAPKSPALSVREAPPRQKSAELKIDCKEVAALLDDQEGIPVMRKVLETVKNETGPREALSGSELAAGLIGFLGSQDFDSALPVLTYLENRGSAAFIDFLRGEYNYLCGKAEEAEKKFEDAAGKDRSFWPAFYRICSLAAGGNRTRYEYKIKKALESLTLGKDFHYECFIGGFSPDYFRRILEKKLTD